MEHANWTVAILIFAIGFAILYRIKLAKKGKKVYIRPIAGIAEIDQGVGRATEMGRPIMFTPGLSDISEIITFVSLSILSHVAKLAARFNARLFVSVVSPAVYPVAEEVCRQSYISEGKLDSFKPDDIRYLSSQQFTWAAATVGIMHREKVATNFMFGQYYAESLIFAEAGQQIGAIQVAGTVATEQIPFFISACDYVLIGEELFAASAYLSEDATMRGSLVGQDIGKLIFLILIVLGVISSTIWGIGESNWFLKIIRP